MSNGKSGFTLATPPTPTIKKEGYTLSICAPAGGGDITVTVADLEAELDSQGIVSPNDAANPVEIVRVYGQTAPKNRLTRDALTDADVVANGATNTYTDEGADAQYVHAGERGGKEVCVLDENCDLIPDETVDDAVAWTIVDGSCMVFDLDVA